MGYSIQPIGIVVTQVKYVKDNNIYNFSYIAWTPQVLYRIVQITGNIFNRCVYTLELVEDETAKYKLCIDIDITYKNF